MKKIYKEVLLEDYLELNGPIAHVIDYLQGYINSSPGHINHRVKFIYGWEDSRHQLIADRLETDEEFKQRLDIEEALAKRNALKAEKHRQKELKMLEKLKQKYEKNS